VGENREENKIKSFKVSKFQGFKVSKEVPHLETLMVLSLETLKP